MSTAPCQNPFPAGALPASRRAALRSRPVRWSAATLISALLLAGCGGGDGAGGPKAEAFSADRSSYLVGERAILSARFSGGSASIDGGIGAVQNGGTVQTPPLDTTSTYSLTVRGGDGRVDALSVTLAVSYRNRYQTLPVGARLSGHASVSLADGSVLLIGGSRGTGTLSERIDRFDPVSRSISALSIMYEGRTGTQALLLPDGKVLIGGGTTSGTDSRRLELLDPATGSIVAAGQLSVPRVDAASTLLADGKVMFCGGFTSGEGASAGISRSCDIWDPATRSVRRIANALAAPRAGHRMTKLRDGRVLISGGWSSVLPYVHAEIFQPASESFTAIASPVTQMVAQHAAVLQPDGSVLLLGGERIAGHNIQNVSAEVWRFDPATNGFHSRPPLAAPRTMAAVVPLRDGKLLLFGGQTELTRHSAGAERYDPASGGQPIAGLDQDRAYLSANRLADGRVLIAGGESIDGQFATGLLIYE
ncbi:Kelch repeat-containing protein [Piscinibacter sakaiensis]|uniref:Kelch repeat-containing protein n=1 Tax=Piscinibacter sakaiensis TaxID=1547922 RepID=UPI003AABC0D3